MHAVTVCSTVSHVWVFIGFEHCVSSRAVLIVLTILVAGKQIRQRKHRQPGFDGSGVFPCTKNRLLPAWISVLFASAATMPTSHVAKHARTRTRTRTQRHTHTETHARPRANTAPCTHTRARALRVPFFDWHGQGAATYLSTTVYCSNSLARAAAMARPTHAPHTAYCVLKMPSPTVPTLRMRLFNGGSAQKKLLHTMFDPKAEDNTESTADCGAQVPKAPHQRAQKVPYQPPFVS